MNEARGIGLDFTECSFRHMADASEVGKRTGSCFDAHMFVFSRVVLKTFVSGP